MNIFFTEIIYINYNFLLSRILTDEMLMDFGFVIKV